MTDKDDRLQAAIKQQLDHEAERLDEDSQRSLRLARATALATTEKPRRGKLWLDVSMISMVVVVAVALYLVTPEQAQLAPVFDDLEMLAGSEEPEFYQELDFYYWLEAQNEQG